METLNYFDYIAKAEGEYRRLLVIYPELGSLSKRELEVADLIARGYRNAEIADILVISAHTVNDHTKKIYRKLNVHSRLEVAALANRQKDPHTDM